jgi:hypothetical protein
MFHCGAARARRRGVILGTAAAIIARPARAQTAVDLLLMLAVDASGSVNAERFELQKHGYVRAFRNPRVLEAIQGGAARAIAVAMVQWTGPALQARVLPWSRIADAASAAAVADAIDAVPRQLFRGGTSISGVIDYAMSAFEHSTFAAPRHVIDISGDGSNNAGRPSDDARDDAINAGVVINGLPILNIEPDLDAQYRDHVIGGAGSFMIAIDSYAQFADAILRKLVTEIAAGASSGVGPG